jgi:hypothetical protein
MTAASALHHAARGGDKSLIYLDIFLHDGESITADRKIVEYFLRQISLRTR